MEPWQMENKDSNLRSPGGLMLTHKGQSAPISVCFSACQCAPALRGTRILKAQCKRLRIREEPAATCLLKTTWVKQTPCGRKWDNLTRWARNDQCAQPKLPGSGNGSILQFIIIVVIVPGHMSASQYLQAGSVLLSSSPLFVVLKGN